MCHAEKEIEEGLGLGVIQSQIGRSFFLRAYADCGMISTADKVLPTVPREDQLHFFPHHINDAESRSPNAAGVLRNPPKPTR